MLDDLGWPDYLLTALLFAVYTFVGIFYGFKSSFVKLWHRKCRGKAEEVDSEDNNVGADEMFLANRRLTLLPIVGSTLASFMSAVALAGNNSEFYLFGLEFLNLIFGYIISFPIAAEVYTPVFYKLNLASGHEYLELRFCRVLRWIVTLVFCFQMIIYIAVVLYAPALALSRVTGLPVSASILTSGIIGTLYTALGGLKAVVWTDALQSIVMFAGLILLMVFGCQQVGGIDRVWSIAKEGHRLDVFDFDPNPFVRHSTWTLAIGGAGMVMSIFATNQTQIQRYLACKDLKTARRAIHLQLPINAMLLSMQAIIGLVAYAVFANCDPVLGQEISGYDQLFPHLVMRLFGNIPALRGLFLSTLFAAALSTLSSGVNGIACVLVEDFFMDIYLACCKSSRLQQKTLTFIVRCIATAFGLLIIGLAFLLQVVPAGVLRIAFSIFGAIGGPILTIFTLGMICPFVNKWGGLAGFVASLTAGLTMIVGTLYFYTFKEAWAPPLSTAGCPTNVTILLKEMAMLGITTVPPTPQYVFSFFNLSYLYLTLFSLIVGFVVATVVSLLTGMNSKSPVSHSLLAWQAVWLYSKLPSCVPPQSTPEVMTSLHATKVSAMMYKRDYLGVSGEEGSRKVTLDPDKDVESVLEYRF
ncbi:Sodium-dependent multivitamin transporter [Taenia crassiceps]|uniref:Sodium-dependent multivitamin transporter n=1 Tax=Taenia crassiceps TaxID=6207 RepID=A0ABR4Q9Z9_9CEST